MLLVESDKKNHYNKIWFVGYITARQPFYYKYKNKDFVSRAGKNKLLNTLHIYICYISLRRFTRFWKKYEFFKKWSLNFFITIRFRKQTMVIGPTNLNLNIVISTTWTGRCITVINSKPVLQTKMLI